MLLVTTTFGPMGQIATSLSQAATRLLLALNHETQDQAAYDQELQDSESSLIAQLQAEQYVPSDWMMSVEFDRMPEAEGLVNVWCHEPCNAITTTTKSCWLQVHAATGAVTRI